VEWEIVLAVCASEQKGHRWGMRVSDGGGTGSVLDTIAHRKLARFEGGAAIDVKGVGASHLAPSVFRSDGAVTTLAQTHALG
jgi:hypothetical protein